MTLTKFVPADKLAAIFNIADEFELTLLNYRTRDGQDTRFSLRSGEPTVLLELETTMDLESLLESSANSEFWRQCLTLGTIFVMEMIDRIPVLPIAAGEKGLKLRYPTMTHVAANLVYQVLRRALEQHMVLDPRVSRGLGGKLQPRLGDQGPWYSQDATFATDLHAFVLTRTPYEVLADTWPQLGKYRRWYDKLFGPKAFLLLDPRDFPKAPPAPFKPASPDLGGKLDRFPLRTVVRMARGAPNSQGSLVPGVMRLFVSVAGERGTGKEREIFAGASKPSLDFLERYTKWLKSINSLKSRLTTNGGMMGDATSFPVMSLQSIYSIEKADHCRPGFDPEAKPSDGELVGDDSLFGRMVPDAVEAYERAFLSLGGVLSRSKTFVHPTKGFITEQPVIDGKKQPYTLLSMWTAPPGGSKGTLNPYSQVTTLVDFYQRLGVSPRKAIWRKTPFRQWHRHLAASGLPVGAPSDLGGLNHPRFQKSSQSPATNQKWLAHISQLTLVQLYTGTGLNPVQTTATNFLRQVGKKGLSDLLKLDLENKAILEGAASIKARYAMPDRWFDPSMTLRTLKPIFLDRERHADLIATMRRRQLIEVDQLVDYMLGPIQSWEFYFRGTIPKDQPRPTLRSVEKNFHRKIGRGSLLRNKRLAVGPTLRDIQRKRDSLAVRDAVGRPLRTPKRLYGLEPNLGPESSRDAMDKIYLTPTGDLTGEPSRHVAILRSEGLG
jgi:hypothetical protein